jgi:hypothetical protein
MYKLNYTIICTVLLLFLLSYYQITCADLNSTEGNYCVSTSTTTTTKNQNTEKTKRLTSIVI